MARKNTSQHISLPANGAIEATNATFILEAQQAKRALDAFGPDEIARMRDADPRLKPFNKAVEEFDRLYRPYVYRLLLKGSDKGGFGFVNKNLGSESAVRYVPVKKDVGITGEEIFTEVWRRLFTTGPNGGRPAILGFDVAWANVGKGAFRNFLHQVVRSVYFNMLKKQSRQPVVGLEGESVGARIDWSAFGSRRGGSRSVILRRVSLWYLAYLHVRANQSAAGWFYQVTPRLFENGEEAGHVIADCLKAGVISDRNKFDVARKRFSDAVRAKMRELSKTIFDDSPGEDEALERAWLAAGKKFGQSTADDIRFRVMKNMIENFEKEDA